MDPLTIGLITGGASLLGSIFNSSTSASNTQANVQAQAANQLQAQSFNAEQAQINRNFQAEQIAGQRQYETQMSNTAYQRSRADMEAAGLNPILAAGAGGASTPSTGAASGATASTTAAPSGLHQNVSALKDLGDNVGRAVSSAVAAKTMEKMTDEMAELKARKEREDAEKRLTEQRKATEEQETGRREHEKTLTELKLPAARFSARQSRALEDIDSEKVYPAEKSKYWSDVAGKVGGAVNDVVAPFVNGAKAVKMFRPRRTTTQESGTDSSGKWYDRFRDTHEFN